MSHLLPLYLLLLYYGNLEMLYEKKKGSILIENLLALLYISIVLVPISNVYIKLFKTNVSIEKKENEVIIYSNVVEYIENMEYKKLKGKTGSQNFNSLNDFFHFYQIENSKIIENKNTDISISIDATNNYYLNSKLQKLYILKLKINNKEYYYFPDQEDYEE